MSIAATALLTSTPASANHNGADISYVTGECGETTFTAKITNPDAGHKVSNMFLVVNADGTTQNSGPIPTNGDEVAITVGPFYGAGGDQTISWNVFGGGERAYDQPLWNGYGGATFSADISAYAAEQGGFSWVLDGPDEPNPFVNWNEVVVQGCAITKDECKNGGYATYGFKNQGLCIQFVNTGKDSR